MLSKQNKQTLRSFIFRHLDHMARWTIADMLCKTGELINLDMGCVNGTSIQHFFDSTKCRTELGKMLDEYPSFWDGADLNQADF
jgi:hypothetical protein